MGRKTMNGKGIEKAKDRDLAGSLPAIHRAAKRARQIAEQTGTALIVKQGERIVRITVTDQEEVPQKPS
jgi:hypothetical protein